MNPIPPARILKASPDATKFKLAEWFYSIQGEGPTTGTPAVFVRVSGCTLQCQWCDTVEVWKQGRIVKTAEFAAALLEKHKADFENGTHLVLTGGDPLTFEPALFRLADTISVNLHTWRFPFVVEVETQGTRFPDSLLLLGRRPWMRLRFNVSPKLSNSGEPFERRIVYEALKCYVAYTTVTPITRRIQIQAIFKFPVRGYGPTLLAEDLNEVAALVAQFKIPKQAVWLMPVASTREDLANSELSVVEAAKLAGYRYSTRLHVHIWNKATGV